MPKKVLILKSSPREKGNSSMLADQVAAGAAKAGALEEEAEANAENEGDDERHLVAEEAVLVERSHDYRHCQRMNQATA